MTQYAKLTLFALIGLLLTACGGGGKQSLAELLPLAAGKPTFIFFYTET